MAQDGSPTAAANWRAAAADPNAAAALAERAAVLTGARYVEKRDRVALLQDYCRGKRVLDVGCVDHHADAWQKTDWLHGRLREVAGSLVGIDYEPLGIEELRRQGHDVMLLDITGDVGALRARGPFDVIVAGEVIEHLAEPQALFSLAAEVLDRDGVLVLTTPNPYAARRVRAGLAGRVWENVDHVTYAFPSGITELAARSGLQLSRYSTLDVPYSARALRSFRAGAVALSLRARGRRAPRPQGRWSIPVRENYMTPLDCLRVWWQRGQAQTGETAVYVVARPGITDDRLSRPQ